MSMYRYSLREKLSACLVGVRQRLDPARDLITGPYTGEFGWELMQWQGYVRERRKHYRQIHVITYPGRDYLYEGCSMHYHDISLHEAGHQYGSLSPQSRIRIARRKAEELGLANYDIFTPALLATQYHKRLFWKQEWRRFEEAPLSGPVRDVAFHFRNVQKTGEHPKNYPAEMAEALVEQCIRGNLSVMCIGHPDYAFCPENAEDRRSVDLQDTVRAISSVRIVTGANSGPMHLANLCGKPTALWAHCQQSIDYSLRWNPFGVPIYIVANNTHLPAPDVAYQQIVSALQDLRQRTNDFREPAYRNPARQIAYY